MNEYKIERENADIRQNGIEYFTQTCEKKMTGFVPHIHPAVEVLYILKGRFRIAVDDREYLVGPGDTVLIRSNAIHRSCMVSDGPGYYYVMKFAMDFLLNFSDGERQPFYLLAFSLTTQNAKTVWRREESSAVAAAVERLRSEAEQRRCGSDVAVRICYGEVILVLLRDFAVDGLPSDAAVGSLARRIYDAVLYINRNYHEDITAEDCCRHVSLSYSYFSRSFRRITGRTFSDYLTVTRINHAEKMLFSTNKSVSEIAADCGFNSFSYFSSKYRELKGVSPTRARTQTGGRTT